MKKLLLLVPCLLVMSILLSCMPKVNTDVVTLYPEYTTRITFFLDTGGFLKVGSDVYTYYVKPNSGWELRDGVLTLTNYVGFNQNSAELHSQILTLSPGVSWIMKTDAREEVRNLDK